MHWQILLVATFVAPAAPDEVKNDIQKMEGSWSVVEAVRGGRKVPAEDLGRMKVIIKGDSFAIASGGREGEKVTLVVDPARKPKAVDMFSDATKEKRLSQGIYELDGQTLKLCWRKEGGERPTEFSVKGDDRTTMLMILRREKQE